jgi:phenylacetate-CoA ligase
MDLYGHLFQRILFPTWEGVLRGRPTLERLRYLEQTQWRSLDELTALQAADLRRLVRHAYDNVPFYQRRFHAAAVGPEDIRWPDDLQRLPIVSRDEAREGFEERAAMAGATVDIKKSTSGTMGKPLVFGYDLPSEHWRQAMKLRGYGWAGFTPGKRSLHYWGAGPPATSAVKKAKVAADRLIKREHYVDCGIRGPAELERVVQLLERVRPDVLLCYSQAGADLARYVNENGRRRWPTIPVLCGAERLLPADRQALEQAFGPAVFETYGSREVMLMATECAAHQGLHISMENLVVEVVVRSGNGTPPRRANPGEVGEVVVTDLHNLGMPFIRYATGDLAVPADDGACPCGRALPRLAHVEGRVTETLLDGEGRRVNGLVFNVVIAHLAHAIRQFQVAQHKDRSVTLRIVPTASFSDAIETTLRETWQKYLPGVKVTIERVADIPLAKSGKRQVVSVER